MRTFTCRSTFLYGLYLSSSNGPDQLKYSPIDRTSAEHHTRHTEQNPQNYLMDFELIIRKRGEKKLEISPPGVSGTFLSLTLLVRESSA